MPDLEKWEMQDPFEVTARREARARRQDQQCGWCIHKLIKSGKRGEMEFECSFRKRQYGTRCDLYRSEGK